MIRRRARYGLIPTVAFAMFLGTTVTPTAADQTYETAPDVVRAVLDSAPLPAYSLAPGGAAVLAATPLRYPPISDLARPMLRLAGLRIDPGSETLRQAPVYTKFSLIDSAGSAAVPVGLQPNAHASTPVWSPDGTRFAYYDTSSGRALLEVATAATGGVERIDSVALNAITGPAIRWFPDGNALLLKIVPPERGRPPAESPVARGPVVQESLGKTAPAVTFEDLLGSAHDEDLFDYHAASQYVVLDLKTREISPLGPTRVYRDAAISPDGKYILLDTIHRPYSYSVPYDAFPHTVVVVDRGGRTIRTIADLPMQENVTFDVVPTGPREIEWRAEAPATLIWSEAQDGGDPLKEAKVRDIVYTLDLSGAANAAPKTLVTLPGRYRGLESIAGGTLALAQDYDRQTRITRTLEVDFSKPGAQPVELFRVRDGDKYHDPGTPLDEVSPGGTRAIQSDGEAIFLAGDGYGPQGRRPFLDRYDLKTRGKTRLFVSGLAPLERVVALLDKRGTRILTERQSPKDPPNLFVRTAAAPASTLPPGAESSEPLSAPVATFALSDATHLHAITHVPDPTPQLQTLARKVVTYRRQDGVELSFTLYLPPGYKEGTRLPTLLWAYPYEYNDPSVAGQNTNSAQTFPIVGGASPIFAAFEGYAVLDNAAVPIVGNPRTVNDTFVEQLREDAQAAIDKAVSLGVTDPARVAVAGHSYGAFMTANLLAHTGLFKAGIARSGAYNRTLTPFGFQSERRTYWEAPNVYNQLSPFAYANVIRDPLLLIHGELDDNTGTFPIQSERMYAAIKGNGGITRLVMLPYEAHGYVARESIETTIAETLNWLDRFVKHDGAKALRGANEGASQEPQ